MSDTPKKKKQTKKQAKKEAESPSEASKAQIAKIKAELRKLLDDEANDDMSYEGQRPRARIMDSATRFRFYLPGTLCTAGMMKAVGSALDTTYSGKKWLEWFTKTAKAIIAELDGMSATDGVSARASCHTALVSNYSLRVCTSVCGCMQSVVASASPSEASKKEISDIKEELTKLLEDEANDDMSYEG